ncbi:protein OSCP1 isoform X1 [Topomyia yanbarensis]|uniref:protein OSCP1 isoform X1 n=1 Tax=Topomyia yanbarensis TaxID=2498891 RepID=UPI00273CE449|nr:protein OSCP1 isoform X1 [Topomyia yanbarensis]
MTITNLFIVLNLGCEMLYVIDQRLKAQTIPLDKSAQVLREITEVLLDPKFLHYISTAYQRNMLTVQQTRILLTDIACCSLMRLDVSSMDKLWDLMIMIFKWQMYLTNKSPQALMDLTFRHLDGIGRLIPEMRKQIMIDNVKKSLIEMWEPLCEDDQIIIHRRVYKWLKPYATKISILIRMGLQKQDGEFETQLHNNVFYNYYINNIGENIYAKTANIQDLKEQVDQSGKGSVTSDQQPIESHEIDTLVQQLNIQHNTNETPEPEMHATDLQRSNSVHTALHEIIINQNEATESKADGPTTSDESNLVKFMKKIKMETDELAVMQVNAKNLNEELLKMFEQKID